LASHICKVRVMTDPGTLKAYDQQATAFAAGGRRATGPVDRLAIVREYFRF